MGYPGDILSTRAMIKHGDYALIPPTGLVNNVVPGLENCRVSIVASPRLGASFVQYIVEAQPNVGHTSSPFAAEDGVESFLYCISGKGEVTVDGQKEALSEGVYAYAPAGKGISFSNPSDTPLRLALYKQRYDPLEGYKARAIFGNASKIEYRVYDEMENVLIKDLLPTDLGFDMNFHILSFLPGGSHPFIETHVQEHGAYILSGEGAYYLGGEWRMIKKDDFVWFGPFTTQGAYGVGREPFTYVYSKDCNRDVRI
ncbi:MAG: (S)-ureidoglycine aminohydrolase [Oscillospiraceae bacterium]|nr:(S)-ureidoglycine aminohydrolase [Oscillospiraceae bacterium]